MVLNQIYEEDFLGFSYGFRPGATPARYSRSQPLADEPEYPSRMPGVFAAQRPINARDFAFIGVAFRTLERRRRSDFRPLSRLNNPACMSVNASRAALRLPAHDSGPGWLATPYLYDSFIRDFTPVYPGALQLRSNLRG
jgi:hypothetical protein